MLDRQHVIATVSSVRRSWYLQNDTNVSMNYFLRDKKYINILFQSTYSIGYNRYTRPKSSPMSHSKLILPDLKAVLGYNVSLCSTAPDN